MADCGATPDTRAEDVPADRFAGTFPGTVWVHYGQIYLVDGEWDMPEWETLKATSVGIVGVQPGAAILLTGLHTGTVGFSVVVAGSDPGADLDGYEDVVEASFESRDGFAALMEWAGENAHELPPLPAGAGTYRLRYHATGMDEAHATDTADEPIDSYLLQIWPAPTSSATTLKRTSQTCAYWQERSG